MQRTGSILVIDPERLISDLIAEVLTDAGYIAYAVQDELSALSVIACLHPVLILMDIGRPGELLTHRQAAEQMTIPIILMTTAFQGIALPLVPGAVACLLKPFNIDDLLTCVARYVQPDQPAQAPHQVKESAREVRALPETHPPHPTLINP